MELGSNIRALRAEQGLTLEALAEKSGVSRAMLSDIERGAKSPTVRVLAQVGAALGCPVSRLLGEQPAPPSQPQVNLVRRKDRIVAVEPRTDAERHLLAPSFMRRGIEVLLLAIPPNSRTTLQAYPPGTEVHITVVRGPVQIRIGSDNHPLDEGDSLQYLPDFEATIVNNEKKPARLFLVTDTNRSKR